MVTIPVVDWLTFSCIKKTGLLVGAANALQADSITLHNECIIYYH